MPRMNVSRKVLSVSLFVVALAGAALACGAEKPSEPANPAGGPVNSAGIPGGPINTGGGPSALDGGH